MKANRRSAPLTILALATLSAFIASCSDTRVIPPPTPVPTPTPRPAPPPPPPPSRSAAQGWQDVPITPGNWTWGMEGGQSVARFAGATFVLRCDRAAGTITLQRGGGGAAGVEPLTVTTTAGVRTLSATPQSGALAVTLPARDPLLDAMAFSRGRFAIETPGMEPLYVPSWPEVSRVSEDCR